MKIAIFGAGYVGLVSAACFADFGHEVVCVDNDSAKVARLSAGEMPIYEPGLAEVVSKNVSEKRLRFTGDIAEGMRDSAVAFIAVGTPSRRGDGHADLRFVHQTAREIAAAIASYVVVATKSTVPVGTGDEVENIIRELRPEAEFAVVSNPEFLREGAAINDFKRPDRIVIGTEDPTARAVMSEVYRPLYLNQAPLVFTDRRTSELIKYAANAFLAMKVSFINEMADLCERVGADVQDVARAIGLDNRIGSKFLHAGPGYGGSCFPKDTRALMKSADDCGAPLRIVEAVVKVNEERKSAMAAKIVQACGGTVRGKTVALLGLTFKPNTDDMREAPALAIVEALQREGARVRATDPAGIAAARELLPGVTFAPDPYVCVEGASAAVLVTEWDIYRSLDFSRLKAGMTEPVFIDLRNVYRPAEVRRAGFTYASVGRPNATS